VCFSGAVAIVRRAANPGGIGACSVLPGSRYQHYLFAVMVIIAQVDRPLLQKAIR
jgi:hypothetical protein